MKIPQKWTRNHETTFEFTLNPFPQMLHSNGFSFAWLSICNSRLFQFLQFFPHTLHFISSYFSFNLSSLLGNGIGNRIPWEVKSFNWAPEVLWQNQKCFFRWPSVQAFHLHRLNFYPIWIFVVELPAIPQKNFRHSWSSEFKARFRKCFWKYFDFFSVLRHYTAHLTKEANFWGNPSLYLC